MENDELASRIRDHLARIGDDVEDLRHHVELAIERMVTEPDGALGASRKALEGLVLDLSQRWDVTVSDKGRGRSPVVQRLNKFSEHAPKLICEHLDTLRRYGNLGSHRQKHKWDRQRLAEGATISLEAWLYILMWLEAELLETPHAFGSGSIGAQLQKDFGLKPIWWSKLHMNREGVRLRKLPVRLLGMMTTGDGGTAWNAGDNLSRYWEPVDICPIRDGDRIACSLVAWSGKGVYEAKGLRLSVVRETGEGVHYRHALLVTEAQESGTIYEALPPSRYSIGAVGSLLLLADAVSPGLRVFDLKGFFRAASNPLKESVGTSKQVSYAFNYRYILPEVANLEVPGTVIPEVIGPFHGDSGDVVILGRQVGLVEGSPYSARVYRLEGDHLQLVAASSAEFGWIP